MANLSGTSGNDLITGTVDADVILAGDGKDTVRGGSGDDIVYGGLGDDAINGEAGNDLLHGEDGNDTLTGDAGNDVIFAGAGNDGVFGGGNNDLVHGEAGTDTIYGDGGNDTLNGGDGDDRLFGGVGDDVLNGGSGINVLAGSQGFDTIEIDLASGSITDAVRADIATLSNWLDSQLAAAGSTQALTTQTTGSTLTLSSLGLSLSTFEAVRIKVDGVETPLASFLNSAPVADASQTLTTDEDTAISGSVAATDADGGALTWSIADAPDSGTLSLDAATGTFVYTPGQNYSGSDNFEITVTDPSGAAVTQVVNVGVVGKADAPVVSVASDTVTLTAPGTTAVGDNSDNNLIGTAGSDTLRGGGGDDVIVSAGAVTTGVALGIAAALSDTDGSESLVIAVAGVPTGSQLSAGTDNGDGSWTLAPADLDGLTLTGPVTADFALTVTATGVEANGNTATSTATINVAVTTGGDLISGGKGSDVITAGNGNDVIYGGKAPDEKSLKALGTKGQEPDHDSIDGGAGNDVISGGTGNDTLLGGTGNDIVKGGKHDDIVTGGDGNDVLYGNSGNDTLSGGDGNDHVRGGKGDDLIFAGSGNDVIHGGSGFDTLDYSDAVAGLTFHLSTKTVTGADNDTFSSIEAFVGSQFDDIFYGSTKDDAIDGGAGDDWIRGNAGRDDLTGGAGDDTFFWDKKDTGGGADSIGDFGPGDVLDFSKLVSVGSKPLGDWVRVKDGKDGSTISAKIDGKFVDVAVLEGVHGTSAAELFSEGQLLVG